MMALRPMSRALFQEFISRTNQGPTWRTSSSFRAASRYTTSIQHESQSNQSTPVAPISGSEEVSPEYKSNRMRLLFLGTGSGAGTRMYGRPCTAVQFLDTTSVENTLNEKHPSMLWSDLNLAKNRRTWLFDTGDGSAYRILGVGPGAIDPEEIDHLFLTHRHADHSWGLISVLRLINESIMSKYGPSHDFPLVKVFAPEGATDFVFRMLASTWRVDEFKLKVRIHEFPGSPANSAPRYLHSNSSKSKQYGRIHEMLPSVEPNPVSISAESVTQPVRHIPGDKKHAAIYNLTKFINYDNVIVRATNIQHSVKCYGYTLIQKLEANRTGRSNKLTILGDTSDPRDAAIMAMDSDVLVHEATLLEQQQDIAQRRGHSTTSMAGSFAQYVGAKKLVLNHISARVSVNKQQARKEVAARYGGRIFFSSDLMGLEI